MQGGAGLARNSIGYSRGEVRFLRICWSPRLRLMNKNRPALRSRQRQRWEQSLFLRKIIGETDMQPNSCIAYCFRSIVRRQLSGVLLLAITPICHASLSWDSAWTVKVNGQLLSVEAFTSHLSPEAAVQAFTRLNGCYERYLVADGRILLSGLGGGRHWLAEVQAGRDGAQGYVSALYFDPAHLPYASVAHNAPARGGNPAFKSDAWALGSGHPSNGSVSQLFEFGATAEVRLSSLPHDVSAHALLSGLREQGWRVESATPEWAQANKGGAQLSVLRVNDGHRPMSVTVSTRKH